MLNLLEKVLANLGKMLSIEAFLRIVKLPSAILLIVVNLIPIVGIAFLKWNPFDILILYWLESIVIGIFNFFRIIFAQDYGYSSHIKGISNVISNLFIAFFFLFHYGIFVSGHGFFLYFGGIFEKNIICYRR